MKRLLMTAMILLAASLADARDTPLPSDSVYHVQAHPEWSAGDLP